MALTSEQERICQKVGIRYSDIEPYRAKIREAKNQRDQEKRRTLENLAYSLEEKAKIENIQRQKLREEVRVKATEDTSWYRELQTSVLASKVAKENRDFLLKKKQQEREKATPVSEGQYAGGMLQEALVKSEQKREKQKQRYLEDANTYNKECAAQKALQREHKSSVPLCPDQEDRNAAKQLAQRARFNTLTEGVNLNRRRLEQEQREEHEREEQCRLAKADLQAKCKLRAQQKLERFQQQQLLRDEALQRLHKFKKEQEVRTRREEEKKEERLLAEYQLLLQQKQEATSRKAAAERDTIAYWGKQVQDKEDQRKQEQKQSMLCFLKEQCERERHLQETERQKAQKRQLQEQCTQFNRSTVAQRSILELRRRKQEQEEQERETQRLRQEHSQYQEYVEREIQAAKVDQRVALPLMVHRHRNDNLHFYKKGQDNVIQRKRSFQKSKHTDVKDEAPSDNGRYIFTQSGCQRVPKYHSTPESQKIKEKIERQHIILTHKTNVSPYSTNYGSVARPSAPNCAPKKLLELRATRTPSPINTTMAANKVVLTSTKKGAQKKYPRLPEIANSKRSECVKLPLIRTSGVKARCQDLSEMIKVIPLRPFVRE